MTDLGALSAASGPTFAGLARAERVIAVYVKTQMLSKYSNRPKGFINHTSWVPQIPPIASLPRSSWDENQQVPFVPQLIWVDLIINNLDDGSHPFHLHGHSFYVLSSYREEGRGSWGSYNPFGQHTAPGGLNLESPLRRDTVSVPRRGHVVLRFLADNPGIWMLHCHMLVHLGSGMAMGLHIGEAGGEEHAAVQPHAADLCG